MKKKTKAQNLINKDSDLARVSQDAADQFLTTAQGLRIEDDQNSLKAGARGPTLLEDFILREKITHFDHERIPERVVHARGAAAHGYFQVYESQAKLTKAAFLQDPSLKTPVFVRFSTVAGSRGSSDLARDVRGFAVKFETTARSCVLRAWANAQLRARAAGMLRLCNPQSPRCLETSPCSKPSRS